MLRGAGGTLPDSPEAGLGTWFRPTRTRRGWTVLPYRLGNVTERRVRFETLRCGFATYRERGWASGMTMQECRMQCGVSEGPC